MPSAIARVHFISKNFKKYMGGGNNILLYLHFERNLNSQGGTKDM